ncbi:hypothetical protein KQI61_07770 [Anaerocolumna aminovalerica]|uniref:hypothetical protein n=1 Tax=Anaerocolumna aminovalerica TaxID=1527 RepID=UPI001C0EE606|nr:hypothetical protein [Anaerocolumna aminovalerica]MBU5332094.1 hypothetical protein [Anaerocolumna aminovalerica]
MFVKNPTSIKNRNIIYVTDKEKEILISRNYVPLSYYNGKWIFIANKEVLEILNSERGE